MPGIRAATGRSPWPPLQESDLAPNGWTPHVDPARLRGNHTPSRPPGGAFGLWAALERKAELTDDHGPSRIAILVVGGDGIATFDALFCQADSGPPAWAIVLQDHGFGGNWTSFGGDSLLWDLASARPPRWLLVADNTRAWPGYELVSSPDTGGMHANARSLFQRR